METLDWAKLSELVMPKKVSYEKNKHLFTKIAFDVFRLNSSPVESLWILEDGEDGKQYLSACYDEDMQEKLETFGSTNWNAFCDNEAKNITLTYKNCPIQRFASSEYGFSKKDEAIFRKLLIEKLNSNKEFVNKLMQSQPNQKREELLKLFPELA